MPWGMSRGTGGRIKEGVPDLNGPGSPVLIWSSPTKGAVGRQTPRKLSHVALRGRVL